MTNDSLQNVINWARKNRKDKAAAAEKEYMSLFTAEVELQSHRKPEVRDFVIRIFSPLPASRGGLLVCSLSVPPSVFLSVSPSPFGFPDFSLPSCEILT